ncbi:hypothetical protein OIU76_004481 [Salix suchowensis]|nr:hypothetical protein OIU76_004481 [Salix suchowensis]
MVSVPEVENSPLPDLCFLPFTLSSATWESWRHHRETQTFILNGVMEDLKIMFLYLVLSKKLLRSSDQVFGAFSSGSIKYVFEWDFVHSFAGAAPTDGGNEKVDRGLHL